VVPFLRALERTGKVRVAAEDAGVDHTTAYARRRVHADFARAWAEALRRRSGQALEEHKAETEEIMGRVLSDKAARPLSLVGSADRPSPAEGGGADHAEELVVSGNQLKRASPERWGPRKQDAFLAELTQTGILRRACDAVRISRQAVDRRRHNDPHFDAACKAAIAACRARIPEFLAGAAAATFDPDALFDDGANPLPKVTVDQAIKMAQLWDLPGPEAAAGSSADLLASDEEVREALVKGLEAFGVRLKQAEDAWEALKLSGADPYRLGQISQVLMAAKSPRRGDSSARPCPHCGTTVHLSFHRDLSAG
jgi:hypothetical protein